MITTFYSFKGGVGRSMAMANVAYELASRGLRVLAIDFDLEAPGLERYFRVPVSTVHATPGVIDLIEQYKRALSGSGDIGPEAEFRQLPRYICPIAEFGGRGRLDLMPAGRRASDDDRRAYALAVRTFDWQDFYFNWEGEAFFEWLRRQLIGSEGREGLVDVVLADSRTGVTEMGGVCACQLADVVVMLTAANHQNIEGTRELAADLASPAVRTLRRNRPPLQIVVVPARVEQRAPDRLADFIQRFDAAFGSERPEAFAELGLAFHDLALPYVPEFAFEEQVTERSSAEAGTLTDAFRRLADALLVLAGPNVPQELRDAARASLQPATAEPAAAAAKVERAFDPTTRFAGYDAYLSFAHAARESARQLAAWLQADPRGLRVQLAETFSAGTDFQAATAELLHHTQALVLLAGEQGVTPFQRAELNLARGLPRPPRVVQVLLPGAADDAFTLVFGQALADSPLIDLRRGLDDDAALQVLLQALRAGGGAAEGAAAEGTFTGQALQPCPFPGAAAFGESDAAMFGGRDDVLAELQRALKSSRRVLLEGPAGCGKTSLVLAALWPALRAEGRTLVRIDLRETPGQPWWRDVAALGAGELLLIDHADEGHRADLLKLAALCKDGAGPALLVVWRGAPLALSEADQIAAWKDAPARAHTQREHALHHGGPPGGRAMLDEALQGMAKVTLAPLDAAGQRRRVERMLARAGRRAETGLLERLFADAGAAPSMALVQRVVAALWPLQARGWLTNEAYERIGGADALFGHALDAVRAPTAGAEREALDALLARLVTKGGSDTLIARTMDWQRECSQPVFAGQAAAPALLLARAGLLAVDAAGATLRLGLAHEPRRCAVLATVAGSSRAEPVLAAARAYAAWCDGHSDEAADARIEDIELAPLRPWLAAGEWFYAQALQDLRRRERKRRRLMASLLVGGFVIAAGYGVWSTRTAQVVAREATDTAAELAAREQTTRLQQAPVSAQAAPAPAIAPAGRTRVVAHRSGGAGADAALVAELLQALPADRFEIDSRIEAVEAEICGDVRYHQPQDVERAREALDRLNQALQQRGDARRLELNDRSQTRVAGLVGPGTIEVWLPPMGRWPATRRDRWGESRLVPPGCAVIGSDKRARDALGKALEAPIEQHFDDELPLRRVWLTAYYIGRHEVTMAQFAAYQRECEGSGAAACPPWEPRFVDAAKEPDRPAVWVGWAQAEAYCRWAGGQLPTELQWEKAARGADGRFWPWGERPDEQRYQGKSQSRRQPVAVGSFPAGDSPYGVADMAGNVWEWTADPWSKEQPAHTIRGGSYLNTPMQVRSSVRTTTRDEAKGADYLGFRCVMPVDR